MIVHYGYEDGSGKYYVSIDAEKCNACNECIERCPQGILKMDTMMIDIEDKQVALVNEENRKKIKYTCASCHQGGEIPCVTACGKGAIATTWEKK